MELLRFMRLLAISQLSEYVHNGDAAATVGCALGDLSPASGMTTGVRLLQYVAQGVPRSFIRGRLSQVSLPQAASGLRERPRGL